MHSFTISNLYHVFISEDICSIDQVPEFSRGIGQVVHHHYDHIEKYDNCNSDLKLGVNSNIEEESLELVLQKQRIIPRGQGSENVEIVHKTWSQCVFEY